MGADRPDEVIARIRDEVTVLSGQLVGLAADLRRLSDALPQQPYGAPATAEQSDPARPVVPAAAPPAPMPPPIVPAPIASYPPPTPRPTPAAHPTPAAYPYPYPATPYPATPYPATPYPATVPPGGQWPPPTPDATRDAHRPTAKTPRRRATLPEVFAIVGSAVTLIGVALVLMLPLGDNAVLGQLPRTIIGLALAAAAVAVAIWQHRADPENVGAQALLATGVASAFLVVLALTVVFTNPAGLPLVPVGPGLVLAGLVGAGGMWIARSWRSQWLAVLAILGSLLLAPWIGSNSLLIVAFMVVMTVGSGAVQPGLGWIWLIVARVAPTALYFMAAAAAGEPDYGSGLPAPTSTAIAVLLAGILAVSGLGLAVMHQSGTQRERIVGAAALVPLSGPLMITVWQADRLPASVACLVVGGVFTAGGAMQPWVDRVVRAATVPLGALFLVFGVLIAGDRQFQGFLYWGLAAAYLVVAARTRFTPVLLVGSVLTVIGFLHWVPLLVVLFDWVSVGVFAAHGVERVIESVLGVAVAVLSFAAYETFRPNRRAMILYLTWTCSVLAGSVAAVLIGALVGLPRNATAGGFQVAHVVVTITLAALSIVLLSRGLRGEWDSGPSVRIAIALAAAAVAKLFLFDLGTLPGIDRAMAFLGVGILLLVVGTWYHRQLGRVRQPVPEPDGTPVDDPEQRH